MATIKLFTIFLVISAFAYCHADDSKPSTNTNAQKINDQNKYEIVKNSDDLSRPDNSDEYEYSIEYVDDEGKLVDYDADNDKYFCENCDDFFEEDNEDEDGDGDNEGEDYEESAEEEEVSTSTPKPIVETATEKPLM